MEGADPAGVSALGNPRVLGLLMAPVNWIEARLNAAKEARSGAAGAAVASDTRDYGYR